MSRILLGALSATVWFDDALQCLLEAAGFQRLTRSQSFVIANIAIGERRASQIARNLGVSRQAISLMLADLQKKGMIEVGADPADRRAQIISFTKDFMRQGKAALEILTDLEIELGRRIGKKRVDALRDALAADWGPSPVSLEN